MNDPQSAVLAGNHEGGGDIYDLSLPTEVGTYMATCASSVHNSRGPPVSPFTWLTWRVPLSEGLCELPFVLCIER